MRPNDRAVDQVRPIKITRNYTAYAEGSVLVEFGNTKVLCNATVEENVPRWLKGQGKGWVTAEYGMLPHATHTRNRREAASGKQGGRTMEIQRLIARSLRAVVDLKVMGEIMITVGCFYKSTPNLWIKPIRPHHSSNPLFIHKNTFALEMLLDSPIPIPGKTRLDFLDSTPQIYILFCLLFCLCCLGLTLGLGRIT